MRPVNPGMSKKTNSPPTETPDGIAVEVKRFVPIEVKFHEEKPASVGNAIIATGS